MMDSLGAMMEFWILFETVIVNGAAVPHVLVSCDSK